VSTRIQNRKLDLIQLLYNRIRRDGFRRIGPKELNIWQKRSEVLTDEYIVSYPSLALIRYAIIGFYALHIFLKLLLFGFLFSIVMGITGDFGTTLILLFVLYPVVLAVVGLGVHAFSRFISNISKGSELKRFREKIVTIVNLLIDLINLDKELYTYEVASCGDKYPDWFDIYLKKQGSRTTNNIFQQEKYLEVYLNTRLFHYADQGNQIYFQINCMGKQLYTPSERLKQLDQFHKQVTAAVPEHYGKNPLHPEVAVTQETLTEKDREQLLQEAYEELRQMIGLTPVKDFVLEMKDMVAIQVERTKIGQSISIQSLHMLFTGNPGTGKTTVARIIAKIFKALGVVSEGHLVEVTREDLVGEYIGHTAPKTRKVIEQAIGGILFIDEAYALSRGGDNDFGKEAIDTLVKSMEENKENLVVILAGYSKEMAEFLKTNSGLKSRFASQIGFPDYTADELLMIAKGALAKEQFVMDIVVEKTLLSVLERKQIAGRNDDGNGRLVRNVIQESIRRQSTRLKQQGYQSTDELRILRSEDFGVMSSDGDFDLEMEFTKIVGNETIKEHIRTLVAQMKIQKLRRDQGLGRGTGQSLHMVFKGNPGTGKTTFARLIGKSMKELGILKSGQLIETDRSGLVAMHIGQTAQKVNDVIKEALGGILFIDEAYALATGGESDFGKEAIDTLVKAIEDHRENLVVILAGYDSEMDRFFQVNAGLASRFSNIFQFADYTTEELYQILLKTAENEQYRITAGCEGVVKPLLQAHVTSGSSSNGRFVRNLFEKAVRQQSVRLQHKVSIVKDDLLQLLPEDFAK
jgi:stage V sporulation protein K